MLTSGVTTSIIGAIPNGPLVPPLPAQVEQVHPRWESMWSNGLRPGEAFDVITASPLLLHYLQEDEIHQHDVGYERLIPRGRALVPGCGRGYDVTALASKERFVIGLDISTTAVQQANARAQQLTESKYIVENKAIPENDSRYTMHFFQPQQSFEYINQIEFRTDSFFDLTPMHVKEHQFDFVYDYTFLCALEPSIRLDWANKMSEVIKPGGVLLTLIFPILEGRVGGPPFRVGQRYCT